MFIMCLAIEATGQIFSSWLYGMRSINMWMVQIYFFIVLIVPVFYYLSLKSVASVRRVTWNYLYYLLIPVFIIGLYAFVTSVISPEEQKFFAHSFAMAGKLRPADGNLSFAILERIAQVLRYTNLAEFILVEVAGIVMYVQYRRRLDEYYSNTDEHSLTFTAVIVGCVSLKIITIILAALWPAVRNELWFQITYAAVFSAFYISLAIYTFIIKFTAEELRELMIQGETDELKSVSHNLKMISENLHSENQKQIAQNMQIRAERLEKKAQNIEELSEEEYENEHENAVLPEQTVRIIEERLDKLTREKFFKDPNVNLIDVTVRIKVNRDYVAKYLRLKYNETFSTFVNRLRIDHAAEMILNGHNDLSIVAEQSGYTTPSTFYRNFRRFKGVAPSEYKR